MRPTVSVFFKRLALTALLAAVPCLAAAGPANTLNVTPASIVMDAQYSGVDLTVTGSVPTGADVLVRVTGTPGELHLREKGKVFGLLWMNVGKVTLSNVPSVCLIAASRPLAQLGPVAASFRLDALTKAIGVEQQGGDESVDIPHELLLLKSREGLYREGAEGISLGPEQGGMQPFTARVGMPSSLKPGTYQVEAIALRDNAVVGSTSATITAALAGFPKWLSELAYQKSALYGVMATVIAIVSGLAIGLVFQSKGAH